MSDDVMAKNFKKILNSSKKQPASDEVVKQSCLSLNAQKGAGKETYCPVGRVFGGPYGADGFMTIEYAG